jgi:hypothetical protein
LGDVCNLFRCRLYDDADRSHILEFPEIRSGHYISMHLTPRWWGCQLQNYIYSICMYTYICIHTPIHMFVSYRLYVITNEWFYVLLRILYKTTMLY